MRKRQTSNIRETQTFGEGFHAHATGIAPSA